MSTYSRTCSSLIKTGTTHPAILSYQPPSLMPPAALNPTSLLHPARPLNGGRIRHGWMWAWHWVFLYAAGGDQSRASRKWMEIPVCGDFGTQARVACDRAKGVCLIIITVVLWALFEIQRVEAEGVWGLTEDVVERGMMGEVVCKHVSICCWDDGNLQKEFSPWPSLSNASGCCPRLNGVTKAHTKTQRSRRRGITAAWFCLPENNLQIKQLQALTKIWHPNQPPNYIGCWVVMVELKFPFYFLFL